MDFGKKERFWELFRRSRGDFAVSFFETTVKPRRVFCEFPVIFLIDP
jgi:hypothetical protein